MNAAEQKERSTVTHQLEKRLNEQFDAVVNEFDAQLEQIARHRVADLLTIAGLEAQLADLDHRTLNNLAASYDEISGKLVVIEAGINRVGNDFTRRTFWQRLRWLFRGV